MMGSAILRPTWLAATACSYLLLATAQTPQPAIAPAAGRAVHLPAHTGAQVSRDTGSTQLAAQIAAILTPPNVARDHWGIEVTTLDGNVLYSLNEAQLFEPASNAKLFTTAAALALLGPNATVTTSVGVNGIFTGKQYVKGYVYLLGGGDANLSGRVLLYPPNTNEALKPLGILDEFAAEIAGTGLKTVDGDVVGIAYEAHQPYPIGWDLDDLVWGYAAPVSMLGVNDNQLELSIAPAGEIGSRAVIAIAPDVPYYTICNDVRTVDSKSLSAIRVERNPGSRELRIYGQIALKAAPQIDHIAVDDPPEFAAIALKQLLEQHGVTVTGRALAQYGSSDDTRSFRQISRQPLDLANLEKIASNLAAGGSPVCAIPCHPTTSSSMSLQDHTSQSLLEDVVLTNKESLNLHAELLLRRLGFRFTFDPLGNTSAEGAAVVRQFLVNAGIDGNDFVFYDGSGLSAQDLVTPRATAKLLQYASTQPWFAAWKASLPVGGIDGTLSSRFAQAPLKGHVFAKTGTLGEARALSGYLDAASGRTIIFSIFVGDHLPNTTGDRDAMDKIVAAIQAAE